MRVPRLQPRTRNQLLASGLFLIAVSSGLGLAGPESAVEERRAVHSAQAGGHATMTSGDEARCDTETANA